MYYANLDNNNFLIGWLNDDIHSKEMISDKAMSVTDDVWIDAVSINANFYDKKTSRFIRKEKPKTKDQHIAEAEQKKQMLLSEAAKAIAPLQDAVDLDMATDEEIALLKEWKKYRVLLNRVDTLLAPDINFPAKPE